MTIIENGNPDWNNKTMAVNCQFCGCKFSGTVNDGTFTVLTENPKLYIYEATCPCCGNTLKF